MPSAISMPPVTNARQLVPVMMPSRAIEGRTQQTATCTECHSHSWAHTSTSLRSLLHHHRLLLWHVPSSVTWLLRIAVAALLLGIVASLRSSAVSLLLLRHPSLTLLLLLVVLRLLV